MYCRNCGAEIEAGAVFCVKCGEEPTAKERYCPNCRAQTRPGQAACTKCGLQLRFSWPASAEKQEGSTKYCRVCGQTLVELGKLCNRCARRPLSGNAFCQECGSPTRADDHVCRHCGFDLFCESGYCPGCGKSIPNDRVLCPYCGVRLVGLKIPIRTDFSDLPLYYQQEFKKIQESKEKYHGKWNKAAAILGPLWAFAKGLSGVAWFWVAVTVVTGGFGILAFPFVFGHRANFIYYSALAKEKYLLW